MSYSNQARVHQFLWQVYIYMVMTLNEIFARCQEFESDQVHINSILKTGHIDFESNSMKYQQIRFHEAIYLLVYVRNMVAFLLIYSTVLTLESNLHCWSKYVCGRIIIISQHIKSSKVQKFLRKYHNVNELILKKKCFTQVSQCQ